MIPEYHMMIAGLLLGLAVGAAIGCALGWLLSKWYRAREDAVREYLDRRKARRQWMPPEGLNCRCATVKIGADVWPKPERGTNSHQPERPFLGRQRPDVPPPPPPAGRNSKEFRGRRPYLDPSRIRLSEQILVDRDELLVLCDRAAGVPYGDLHALKRRARQMMEKIGQDIREENRP